MCTALTYKTKDFYFGRNLDYEHGYGQSIIVVPRNYPIPFRHMKDLVEHQIKCTKKIKLNAKRNNVKFNSIQII